MHVQTQSGSGHRQEDDAGRGGAGRDPASGGTRGTAQASASTGWRHHQAANRRESVCFLYDGTQNSTLRAEQVKDVFPDVDDTDGLDPTAEFEAWKLRELQRIKRDADALYARELERDAVEARRALPEDVRLAEDLARAEQTRRDKPKGQQAFLQKYHHKGVFYTDDEILQRDYTANIEDQVTDMKALPSLMQVRDFGKRSRTKHTHLAAVDTSVADAGWGSKALGRKFAESAAGSTSRACFNCGMEGHVRPLWGMPPSLTSPQMSKDCPMPKKERTDRPAQTCFNCGETGHVRSSLRS
jgi:hypothetical protein